MQKLRVEKPALELYADDTHPSVAGTYLAACVFYATVWQKSPKGAWHPAGIDDATAALLQKSAEAQRR